MPHFITQTKVNPIEELVQPKMLGSNKLVSQIKNVTERDWLNG